MDAPKSWTTERKFVGYFAAMRGAPPHETTIISSQMSVLTLTIWFIYLRRQLHESNKSWNFLIFQWKLNNFLFHLAKRLFFLFFFYQWPLHMNIVERSTQWPRDLSAVYAQASVSSQRIASIWSICCIWISINANWKGNIWQLANLIKYLSIFFQIWEEWKTTDRPRAALECIV